ncbi:MAG: HAMP domain-containing sensor histidine kinase [Paraburkholderia sp.]|jgi:signal transduction histidine kinase
MSLWRSTIFRLLMLYALVFAGSVLSLVWINYWNSANYTATQADNNISWQFEYFEELPRNLLLGQIDARIKAKMRQPVNFYGVFAADGQYLAGDIARRPAGVEPDGKGVWFRPQLTPSTIERPEYMRTRATRLPDGGVLVIARDVDEMTRLRAYMLGGIAWSGAIALLGGLGFGILCSAVQLRRIKEMRRLTHLIAQGNLDTRLPERGGDELAWLSQIVNHMLDEISRLMNEVKSACDGIAHDLRTPLIHIRSLLARIEPGALKDEDAERLQHAARETDDVLARFSAMLRISEIEALHRRAQFSDTQMHVLCQHVGELYTPVAAARNVELQLDLQPVLPVRADYPLLFEALVNIVDNAIKFASQEGKVVIAVRQCAEGPRITVRDAGPGIPAGERQAVLQRFYRSERTRDTPGSGLGLSVVQAVAHLHEFRLTLEDARPGTRVVLDCWPERERRGL